MASDPDETGNHPLHGLQLKKLTADHIRQIDETLASLNDSGELRLVIQHGELRFINKVEVHPADDNDALEDEE